MRVAGSPRAITAAKYVAVCEAIEADTSLSQDHRAAAAQSKQKWMETAAYMELADLDRDYVADEMGQFKARMTRRLG